MHSHALRTTEPGRQSVRQAPEPVTTHFCVLVLSLSGYTRFRRLMRTEISSDLTPSRTRFGGKTVRFQLRGLN